MRAIVRHPAGLHNDPEQIENKKADAVHASAF
jgi:hypothetical protein